MSNHAFGAAESRAFNPATDPHFAMREDTLIELRTLFAAMQFCWQVCDIPPGEVGPEIQPQHVSPLFLVLSNYGQRLLDDGEFHFPGRERKSA